MPEPLTSSPASGAYCELAPLIELRFPARKLDMRQRRRALSLLSGVNRTNLRGRGIDFEEVRAYQAGDDIRTIDWRVTARTGTAHTKIFREERERPVLMVVDQRAGMFFGSRHCCKSVLAAHLAALASWASLQRGDRLGGLVYNGREHHEVRPRRSRRAVLALLNHLVAMNHSLPLTPSRGDESFSSMLVELRRIARPGAAVFIVSDFAGATRDAAVEQLYQLSRHTEITALHVSDPLERELPSPGRYTASDGRRRTRLHTGDAEVRREFAARFDASLEALRGQYARLGIPLIEAATDRAPFPVLQSLYSEGGRR